MSKPSRREFLTAAAAGAAGLALPGIVAAKATAARHGEVLHLHQHGRRAGSPRHVRPQAGRAVRVRGPFQPIRTKVPGIHLSELFPKLARLTDKFCLIRSMHHAAPPIHEAGFQLLNTGRLFRDGPEWPSVGAVVDYLRQHSDRGSSDWIVLPDADVNTGIIDQPRPRDAAWPRPRSGQRAARAAPPDRVLDYGCREFGRNCRAGLTNRCGSVRHGQFVTINQFSTVFDSPSWDCHADGGSLRTDLNDIRDTVAPSFDTAFAALLTDLDERGLLDTTLVVATGEFGRTPKLNANGGRDHWAGRWTALVAGGGVKGGRVIGRTDAKGTEPTDRPVTPQELVATIFHALGVPPDATIPGPDGAPVAVYPGKPGRGIVLNACSATSRDTQEHAEEAGR